MLTSLSSVVTAGVNDNVFLVEGIRQALVAIVRGSEISTLTPHIGALQTLVQDVETDLILLRALELRNIVGPSTVDAFRNPFSLNDSEMIEGLVWDDLKVLRPGLDLVVKFHNASTAQSSFETKKSLLHPQATSACHICKTSMKAFADCDLEFLQAKEGSTSSVFCTRLSDMCGKTALDTLWHSVMTKYKALLGTEIKLAIEVHPAEYKSAALKLFLDAEVIEGATMASACQDKDNKKVFQKWAKLEPFFLDRGWFPPSQKEAIDGIWEATRLIRTTIASNTALASLYQSLGPSIDRKQVVENTWKLRIFKLDVVLDPKLQLAIDQLIKPQGSLI